MQKPGSRPPEAGYIIFSLTASMVIVADQLSKVWIRANLAFGESIPIAGFFHMSHVRNTGAAFGLFQGYSPLLAVISIVGILFMLFLIFVMHHRIAFLSGILGRVTLGLLFGGMMGNLLDRLISGYVTDFIDFSVWPAFNIADSAIVVGVILFAYSLRSLASVEKH